MQFDAIAILESITDAFYALDRDWCFTYVNGKAEELWGRSRESLLGRCIWHELPQTAGSEAQAAHFRAVREQAPVRFELISPVFHTWIAGTVFPADGGVAVYYQDISERRRMEVALRESEERYRQLASLAREAIVVHDQGRILDVNENFLALFGYSYDDARRMHGLDFVAPECREALLRRMQGGGDGIYETRGVRKDGSTLPLEVHARASTYRGRPARVAVLWDLSPRVAAQAERERLLAELQTVLEQLPAGVIVTDARGTIRHANHAARHLCGETLLQPAAREDAGNWQAHHPDGTPYTADELPLARALRSGSTVTGEEMRFARGDGRWQHVSVSAAAVRDQNGTILAGVAILDDLTVRMRAEHLAVAIREAHHRIGNNLQAVTDVLSLALAEMEVGRTRDVIQATILRVQAMGQVHVLLRGETDFDEVDVGELLRKLVPAVLRNHAAHTAALDLRVQPFPLPSSHATTLALVVNELVSNAARYGLAGRATGLLQVCCTHSGNCLRLVIRDDGPGLPAGFDLAVDAGLGLQLVQALAEHTLGGDLALTSESGVQAELTFAVERRKAPR